MARKRRSQAWKALERQTAKALRGQRLYRGADFSIEDVDVEVPDFPELRIDAKYRVRHAHHTFMNEIVRKYCEPGQEPVLVTKTHRQESAFVTIRLEHYAELLDLIRHLVKEKK